MATNEIACVQCGNGMDPRRAALPIANGRCVPCNAPLLTHSELARSRAPQYETARLERGERLD